MQLPLKPERVFAARLAPTKTRARPTSEAPAVIHLVALAGRAGAHGLDARHWAR